MQAPNCLLGVEQQTVAAGQFDLDLRTVGLGDRQAEQAVKVRRVLQVFATISTAAETSWLSMHATLKMHVRDVVNKSDSMVWRARTRDRRI
jgi:hypothetical protein